MTWHQFSWQAQYFRQVDWKNRKTHWYESVSSARKCPFLKDVSQNSSFLMSCTSKNEEVSQNCFVFTLHTLPHIHHHTYITIHTLPYIHYHTYFIIHTLPYITIHTLPYIHYHTLPYITIHYHTLPYMHAYIHTHTYIHPCTYIHTCVYIYIYVYILWYISWYWYIWYCMIYAYFWSVPGSQKVSLVSHPNFPARLCNAIFSWTEGGAALWCALCIPNAAMVSSVSLQSRTLWVLVRLFWLLVELGCCIGKALSWADW